jgi:hypothetical protein
MDNNLRYFLTAFFGSLGIFVLVAYGYAMISGGDSALIAIIGKALIYFTVPVFILVAVNIYRPGWVSKKETSLYVQVVLSLALLLVMFTLWSYIDGRGSRFLRMGFSEYWSRMLQGSWFAIVYFSLAVPILLKIAKNKLSSH